MVASLPPLHFATDVGSLAYTVSQCFMFGSYSSETASPMPYSKFSALKEGLHPRTFFAVIYTPAMLAAAGFLATAPNINGRELLFSQLVTAHFVKRVGETFFVHTYSDRRTAARTSVLLSFLYAFWTIGALVQQRRVPLEVYQQPGSSSLLTIGLALFFIGEAGNGWHHWLLARLRSPKAAPPVSPAEPQSRVAPSASTESKAAEALAKTYRIPEGGLFGLVNTPHYLFEIMAWFGMGLVAQQFNVLLTALHMSVYLAARAKSTTRWYKEKFGDDWPKHRRHMIPFIF